MNKKNVIIAGLLALTLVGGEIAYPKQALSDNEVIKVPAVDADVPLTVELPFLYSQQKMLLDVEQHMTNNVQKDGVANTAQPTVSKVNTSKKALKKNKKGDSFKEYNIPLSKDLQKYIHKLSKENDISETLVYAMIRNESEFDPNAISSTGDYGLMQINKTNFEWIANGIKKKYGITFRWDDPYANVTGGIYYLSLIRDEWSKKYSGDSLMNVMLLSYNMGSANAKKYLRHHSASDWKYVKKIKRYKDAIEKGEKI